MRLKTLVTVTVGALAIACAAEAQQRRPPQQWGVNGSTPVTSADGSETYCMLWTGRSPQPLFNIKLTPAGRRMNLGSAELAGGAGGRVPVEIRFPGGRAVTIGGGHGDGVVSIALTEAALDVVLEELKHDGDFVIAVSGHTFTFPVNNVAGGVEILRSCGRQLTS